MNETIYIISASAFLIACLIILVVILSDRRNAKHILWLKESIVKKDKIIADMQDRILSKSHEEYKMWSEPNTPPPPIAEEEFDDSRAGTVSGEESPLNA